MNIKKYIYIGLLSSLFASCSLESEDYSTINTSIFPKTEEDAKTLVTNCYMPFICDWYIGIYSSCWRGIHVIGDMTTDIGKCQWQNSDWFAVENLTWKSTSSYVTTNFWDYYREISKMTLTIDRVSKIPFADEKLKNRLLAEVHCAKGYMGYLLYDWFGPIPVATLEELKDPLADKQIPRLSEEEMQKFIEDELVEAAKVLPYKYPTSEYGRFTKGLANTLLMKLYMLTKQWSKAEAMGRELMKSEYGYGLMDDYKSIFSLENEGNKEIIFACTNTLNVPSLWLAHVLPGNYPTKNKNILKWNGYRTSWAFFDTYESNDKRLETVVSDYIGTNGVHQSRKNPGSYLALGAIPIKCSEDPASTGEASSVDWVVFRYADVLTLLSEAIVRNGNKVTEEAVNLLNMIKHRAGVKETTVADYPTVQSFLDDLLLERGHEFAWEGCRRSDLIRHGKYIEYAKKKAPGITTATEYYVRMPIPESAIVEGKGKIIPNPGY